MFQNTSSNFCVKDIELYKEILKEIFINIFITKRNKHLQKNFLVYKKICKEVENQKSEIQTNRCSWLKNGI